MPALMQRKLPYNMQEFRLIDCKITLAVSAKLIDMIADGSTLQKLALVNVNLSERSVETITKYTQQSKHIEELDLSWCKTSRSTWTNFFEVLRDN